MTVTTAPPEAPQQAPVRETPRLTSGHLPAWGPWAILAGSLAMALLALQGGATILRVHDVKETRDVIAVWEAFVEALK